MTLLLKQVIFRGAEAIRYLDIHPVLPQDAPPELGDSYDALLAPLLLNSALAAIKSGQANVAIDSATRALERLELNIHRRGLQPTVQYNVTISANYSTMIHFVNLLAFQSLKQKAS